MSFLPVDKTRSYKFIRLPIINGSKFNHFWSNKFSDPGSFTPSLALTTDKPYSISLNSGLTLIDKTNGSYLPIYIGGQSKKLESNINIYYFKK